MIKTSIIISVYKDIQALQLILESLTKQTVLSNEIIVSEDGESVEIKNFINSIKVPNLIHLSQKDNGWQKNKALNRAIIQAQYEYLIFIDGDCVPFFTFIESHKLLAKKNHVLCGRRSEPGEYFSKLLREKKLSHSKFIKDYKKNYFQLKTDNIRHYDESLYLHPHSKILKFINLLRYKKENHIVGCNFSCFKSDLEKINGFDEDFTQPTTGEDTDIERRMRHFGIKMSSCRYSANMIHLYHEKNFNPEITKKTEALMESKKSIYFCHNGLKKETH